MVQLVVNSVTGPILWANMHLLFWLSLTPYAMRWIGENHLAAVPVALYGVLLLANAVAYTILTVLLLRHEGRDSALAKAIGSDLKGKGLAGDLCRRRRPGLRKAAGRDRLLRPGGGDLVHPGPPGRAGSGGC